VDLDVGDRRMNAALQREHVPESWIGLEITGCLGAEDQGYDERRAERGGD
jgi:hypothetical protein